MAAKTFLEEQMIADRRRTAAQERKIFGNPWIAVYKKRCVQS
jgi:hypothetical protein